MRSSQKRIQRQDCQVWKSWKVGQSSKGGREKSQIIDQRQVAVQWLQCPPSTAFLEIEDSKARSEKMASHTHLLPSVPQPFVTRTFQRRNKVLVATPSARCTGGGFINEVLPVWLLESGAQVINGTTWPQDWWTTIVLKTCPVHCK